MKRIGIYVNIASAILVGLIAWTFWMFIYPAHLHLHEQLQIFEFTGYYFADTIAKPAGLAEYLSRFLVQFFYDDKLGPVVVAIVSALLYNATTLLYRPTASVTDRKAVVLGIILKQLAALLPVVMATAFLIGLDAKFTLLVAMCITLYAVWLTELLPSRIAPYAAAIVSILLAFAVGSVFVVYPFAFYGRLAIRGIEEKKWRHILWIAPAFALWGISILILGSVYPYPTGVLTWGDYYNRFIFVSASYNVITWWGTVLTALLLAFTRTSLPKILLPVLALYVGYDASRLCDSDEESMLENLYLVRTNNWDAIIEKASHHAPASSYELTGLNLALAMKGQLADMFFHYPGQGPQSLLPVYQMDYMTPLFSAEAYYQMGLVNTAQRFYYEAMESIADHQKSAWYLKRLTLTALANGRINLARTYIYKLKQTLYYSQWAKDMERYCNNPELIDSNVELSRLRKLRVKHDTFFNDNYPAASIIEMLNDNADNSVAWQYLFAQLMAVGDTEDLLRIAPFYMKNYPDRMFPVHVQEALLYGWLTRTGTMNGFPWKVSMDIGQRFLNFVQQANQPSDVAEPIVRRDYADTFWCYAVLAAKQGAQQAVDANTSASTPNSSRE